MATYYLVSTKKSGTSTLMWRPANSNGTPTGGAGGSKTVSHNDLLSIPYLKRTYIIQIASNCELYLATTGGGGNGGGGGVWVPDTLICNGSREALVRYE